MPVRYCWWLWICEKFKKAGCALKRSRRGGVINQAVVTHFSFTIWFILAISLNQGGGGQKDKKTKNKKTNRFVLLSNPNLSSFCPTKSEKRQKKTNSRLLRSFLSFCIFHFWKVGGQTRFCPRGSVRRKKTTRQILSMGSSKLYAERCALSLCLSCVAERDVFAFSGWCFRDEIICFNYFLLSVVHWFTLAL